jgi:hypothetical protein
VPVAVIFVHVIAPVKFEPAVIVCGATPVTGAVMAIVWLPRFVPPVTVRLKTFVTVFAFFVRVAVNVIFVLAETDLLIPVSSIAVVLHDAHVMVTPAGKPGTVVGRGCSRLAVTCVSSILPPLI